MSDLFISDGWQIENSQTMYIYIYILIHIYIITVYISYFSIHQNTRCHNQPSTTTPTRCDTWTWPFRVPPLRSYPPTPRRHRCSSGYSAHQPGINGEWGAYMGVSKNNGTPKSSILIGFSIINHPFWGTPIFGNTHIGASS